MKRPKRRELDGSRSSSKQAAKAARRKKTHRQAPRTVSCHDVHDNKGAELRSGLFCKLQISAIGEKRGRMYLTTGISGISDISDK